MINETLYGHPKWLFISIFGRKWVDENSHKTLEDFFNSANQVYCLYITSRGVYLAHGGIIDGAVKDVGISNLRAYQIFGLMAMEEAVEKTRVYFTKEYYRKKIIEDII